MSDPMNDLRPGQPVTEEQKKKLAEANAKETAEAHRLAAEHRAQDSRNEPPLVNILADSVKEKLKALPPLEEGSEPAQQ